MSDYSSTGKERGGGNQKTEQAILDVVKALRKDPEKYKSVRKAIDNAKTDEERVRLLLQFATSNRELSALVPAGSPGEVEAAWTTVTITTVFIPRDAH